MDQTEGGTSWDVVTVKSKIAYTKKKYDAAQMMTTATGAGDTEDTTLRDAMLAECPYYDRLHAVYAGCLKRNPPPPKQPPLLGDPQALEVNGNVAQQEVVDFGDALDSIFDSDDSTARKCLDPLSRSYGEESISNPYAVYIRASDNERPISE